MLSGLGTGSMEAGRVIQYQVQDDIGDEASLEHAEEGARDEEARLAAQPELRGGHDAPETHDGWDLDEGGSGYLDLVR